MIDFSKLDCPCRSGDLVSNFCTSQQCQVGLCASCICIHTQLHMEKNTSPTYENIRDTYKQLNDDITKEVQQLDKIKFRIEEVEKKSIQKKLKVKEIINEARNQTQLQIADYYQRKEEEMLKEIEVRDKKQGLHCHHRFEVLKSGLSREISTLVEAFFNLNEKSFLQTIPKIKSQTLYNSKIIGEQIQAETKENQFYNTTLTYNKNLVNQLQSLLDKSVTLSISNNYRCSTQTQLQPQLSQYLQHSSKQNQIKYLVRPASQPPQRQYKNPQFAIQQNKPIMTFNGLNSQGSLEMQTQNINRDCRQPGFINVFNQTPTFYHSPNQHCHNTISRTQVQFAHKQPQLNNINQGIYYNSTPIGGLSVRDNKDIRASLDSPYNGYNIPNYNHEKNFLSKGYQIANNDKFCQPKLVLDCQGNQNSTNMKKILDKKCKKQFIQRYNSQVSCVNDNSKENIENGNIRKR